MDERCISVKYLMVVFSFVYLLNNHLAVSTAADKYRKDNHTIRDLKKINDYKATPSNFNFRMHKLHPLFDNNHQIKRLYTNLGSANNQIQFKYITGQGLLSPLIIRASDLSLANEQAQLHGLPEFLNEFNNLNQNQYLMMRPPRPNNQIFHFRPNPFSIGEQNGMNRKKNSRRKRKKNSLRFNYQDLTEFTTPNSIKFTPYNSDFPIVNLSPMKKNMNFEKSYNKLVNSAKKLVETVEIDDSTVESEGKDNKSKINFESNDSKFNFDDEMQLSQKDEDELDNLDKLENTSGFNEATFGQKKNKKPTNFYDFESNEKIPFSPDNDKFGDLFNDKLSDLFKDNENNDKYDEDKSHDNYEKLDDKIINSMSNNKTEKSDNYELFDDAMSDDIIKTKPSKAKKANKKKKPINESGDDNSPVENTNDESTPNKYTDDMKTTNENEQSEYNSNTSSHLETGEYDYSGYAKDPNEQSEEATDNEVDKSSGDKNDDANKGSNDGNHSEDAKYQDEHLDQQTTISPSENDYKEQSSSQPTKTDDELTERGMRSFKKPKISNLNSFKTQKFTRMPIKSSINKSDGRFKISKFNSELKIGKSDKPGNYSETTKSN